MAFLTAWELYQGVRKLLDRATAYRNEYPWNCGFYDGERLYGDCWNGFPKSTIWGCACGMPFWDNYEVGEDHVARMYNQGIAKSGLPDWTVDQIADNFGKKSWDFSDMDMGTFLAISGQHAGVFVGEFGKDGYVYNAAEFNSAWYGDGCLPLWVDSDGSYYTRKGGDYIGKWDYNFTLPQYIDYSIQSEQKKEAEPMAVEPTEKLNPSKDDWYYEDCEWAKKNGIMTGYSDGNMYPDKNLTRGEACALMHRLYNLIKAD